MRGGRIGEREALQESAKSPRPLTASALCHMHVCNMWNRLSLATATARRFCSLCYMCALMRSELVL